MLELNEPYGGKIKELFIDKTGVDITNIPVFDLDRSRLSVVELLISGALSPLEGFMNEEDYLAVKTKKRLSDGRLWPLPVALEVDAETGGKINNQLALRDEEGVIVALLEVADSYQVDGRFFLGGKVKALEPVVHYDFKHLRHGPKEIRANFKRLGWNKTAVFHSGKIMHRAEIEMVSRAARLNECNLLLQPLTGAAQSDDISYFSLLKAYEKTQSYFAEQSTFLSVLPFTSGHLGEREIIMLAIIAKNYGLSHIILPPEYGNIPEPAAIGIEPIAAEKMVYIKELGEYKPENEVPPGSNILEIDEDELAHRIQNGIAVEDWFSYPDILSEAVKIYPPLKVQGFTVFFTGLSGSGKSTIANALQSKLMEEGSRPVTLLDGDIVRKNLSSELGFSQHDRSLNIRRIGFVASEISKNLGVAICAPIAPYAEDRRWVRNIVEARRGRFIEVYVATPLEECERRDRKGLYAKARKGIIKNFTGVNDPYEQPENPDIVVDTMSMSPDEAAHMLVLRLTKMGLM